MRNNIEEEIWKDIPGYEGSYQVSDLGRVKGLERIKLNHGKYPFTIKERFLSFTKDRTGYHRCKLSILSKSKTFRVHQLVAKAFLGHVPDGTHKIVIDHINNDKTDNRVENLQLISQRENCNKTKRKNTTSKYVGVYLDNNRWRVCLIINCKKVHLGVFKDEFEASKTYQKASKNVNLFEGCNKTFKEKLKNAE